MNNNQGRRRTRRVRQQRKQKSTQISRILLTICMMALVAVVSIGGTLAWLTDKTTPVVNTFTESDVDIDLTETDSDDADTDNLNNSYKMIPGSTITKDPKVTVLANSEACYVFVKLEKENRFDEYLTYGMADGWIELTGYTGVYYRTVAASDANQEFGVIANNQVTVKDGVTKAMMDALVVTDSEGNVTKTYPKLTITAYAIQSANLTADAGKSLEETAWTLAQTNGAVTP